MNVEYIYDEKTQQLIDQFQGYLSEYESHLMDKLNNHTCFGNAGLLDTHRAKREAFLSDPVRQDLEKQVQKVFAMAIPEKIVFTKPQ